MREITEFYNGLTDHQKDIIDLEYQNRVIALFSGLIGNLNEEISNRQELLKNITDADELRRIETMMKDRKDLITYLKDRIDNIPKNNIIYDKLRLLKNKITEAIIPVSKRGTKQYFEDIRKAELFSNIVESILIESFELGYNYKENENNNPENLFIPYAKNIAELLKNITEQKKEHYEN